MSSNQYTFRVTTEYTSSLMQGWWLVIEDTSQHPESKTRVFSIPINAAQDTGDVLYPLLGVGWKETEQLAPRTITNRVILESVEYALSQALSRREPLSTTAFNLLSWVQGITAY